eukprot:7355121-Lingulodinium_polyedra.AAC.1
MCITVGYAPPRSGELVVGHLVVFLEFGESGLTQDGARWFQSSVFVSPLCTPDMDDFKQKGVCV